MSEWLPIETAPKVKDNWIMLYPKGGYAPIICFWNSGGWDDGDFNSGMRDDSFTHWMPLPEPPK